MKTKNILIYDSINSFTSQIALGFHAINVQVGFRQIGESRAFTTDDDAINTIIRSGKTYDVLLSNLHCIKKLAIVIQKNKHINWKGLFSKVIIFQMHDAVSEACFINFVEEAFNSAGIPLIYWTSCAESKNFIDKHAPNIKYIYEPLSIDFDNKIDVPMSGRLMIDDISQYIVKNNFHTDAIDINASDSPILIYFGQADMPVQTNPLDFSESNARFSNIDFISYLNSYTVNQINRGKPINRIGFIDNLLENKILLPEEVNMPIAHQCISAYAIAIAQELRRRLCRALQAQYGERFYLFGNNWRHAGMNSRPAEPATESWHRKAAISIDFGSLFIDSALYTRSQAILQWGGAASTT